MTINFKIAYRYSKLKQANSLKREKKLHCSLTEVKLKQCHAGFFDTIFTSSITFQVVFRAIPLRKPLVMKKSVFLPKPLQVAHYFLLSFIKELQAEANAQVGVLSSAEVAATTICSERKDDLKATHDINKSLAEVQTLMLDLLERLQSREQDLKSAQEHLEAYKAQLEPVQEVFFQVESSVEAQAPVDLNKGEDELGKVDVSEIRL